MFIFNHKLITGLISLLALASVQSSQAGSVTSGVKSSATLSATCTLSAGSMNFGSYNPAVKSNTTANSNISFVCTKNTVVTVNLNGSAANINQQGPAVVTNSVSYAEHNGVQWARYMVGGTSAGALSYNLFQDSGYSQIFGGTNWFSDITGHNQQVVATGASQNITVYGAIAYGQYVNPDNYSDSVPVLLTF